MLKQAVISLINKMPAGLQEKILSVRNKRAKYKIIKNWEHEGKPVPPPHQVKQTVLEFYQQKTKCKILVETGTYLGSMVEAQRNNFSKIYSIELDNELWKNAVKKFIKYKHIEILNGDSGKVLNDLVPKLQSQSIFWLDGHYSGGITAKGEKECPIYEELDAILKNNILKHIIIIDDARCFTGAGDYPTIEALYNYVKFRNPEYHIEVKDDSIRFTSGIVNHDNDFRV